MSVGNQYPANPNAMPLHERPVQFSDGQLASSFTDPGDVIQWGALPNADPALDPSHQVIIRTEQDGSFLIRDGNLYDLAQSVANQRVVGRRDLAAASHGLPDVALGSSWEVSQGRFVTPTGVLIRDGGKGNLPDPNRVSIDQPNPFDVASAQLEAIAKQAKSKGDQYGNEPARVSALPAENLQDKLRQERLRRSLAAAQPAGNLAMRNLVTVQLPQRRRSRDRDRDRG